MPGSNTPAIAGIAGTTNVGLTGRWAFRVDNGPVSCDDDDYVPVVGDDPHLLVHPLGLDRPVCFEFDGFNGDIYQLVSDTQNDFVLNAQIVTPAHLHSRRTFFSDAYISRGPDAITCTMEGIMLNGSTHTWEDIRDETVGSMTVTSPIFDTLVISVRDGIEVTIRRDFSKVADHLDIFISESADLSENTKGLLGEFLFKQAVADEVSEDGIQARLHFPATNRSVAVKMARKRLLHGDGHIGCWEVTEDIDNMMDSSIETYLISVLQHHL